ncbi:hypothetical protein PQO01_08190 [Lentisphaera marina]|uniref:hypothetical protein n=1 Tax=Lentisphaera marina TaxID=1111041 RepID=UPI002366914E|nr:hypothetical protein [Lentisphaera marina]MDD7984922.1 hypothetical protein [Lentisphaera marina]
MKETDKSAHIREEETTSKQSGRLAKDFKNLTIAQQTEILKKHDPEAFAKINKDIVNRAARFRKFLHLITIVAVLYLFYFLLR